ncbi:hypothetical protein CODIS_41650 [Candidatus Thiodiazotropha endolucinida]|uniref:Uncharacterized protein n=1 Tax=Candidatus Thiodiazotropha endolucinida TaxID=1655433 RepID=A0A7Z0VHW2_9GAMM|nr:hypothetical protein CODIS_41650 [Candidatus Thiodiazotropha endolucinida]
MLYAIQPGRGTREPRSKLFPDRLQHPVFKPLGLRLGLAHFPTQRLHLLRQRCRTVLHLCLNLIEPTLDRRRGSRHIPLAQQTQRLSVIHTQRPLPRSHTTRRQRLSRRIHPTNHQLLIQIHPRVGSIHLIGLKQHQTPRREQRRTRNLYRISAQVRPLPHNAPLQQHRPGKSRKSAIQGLLEPPDMRRSLLDRIVPCRRPLIQWQ